jgi:hypothetical protein
VLSIQVTAREQDMNALPNIDPVNLHSDSDVVRWLTNDTRDQRFIDNIFAELCVRVQQGVRWNLKSSTSNLSEIVDPGSRSCRSLDANRREKVIYTAKVHTILGL